MILKNIFFWGVGWYLQHTFADGICRAVWAQAKPVDMLAAEDVDQTQHSLTVFLLRTISTECLGHILQIAPSNFLPLTGCNFSLACV